jgi:putative tryptophan/tyrosine transport system substrate-binding protein
MKRGSALGIALLGVLGGLPVAAQQGGKTYRVAILIAATSQRRLFNSSSDGDAFFHTLSGLGYQEGKNLEIDYRGADGDYARLPDLAAEIVRAKPDVIVASSAPAIAAAKRATASIPIVMGQSPDPIGSGFVASLARPGGNVTGLTNIGVELAGKWLQLLGELVPRMQRLAVMRNPANPPDLAIWHEAQSMARTMKIQVVAVDIAASNQIDAVFKTIPQLHADAILVLPTGVVVANTRRVVRLIAEQRLPAVYGADVFTAAGGLISYAASEASIWSQVASYVDRILKGAKPADLPVERPTTFELVVNLKTAHAMGITVPQSILLRADQVIK